jgi:hypothetical protein
MTSSRPRQRDEMFVIRIWSEEERAVRTGWRASVTHVSSGQRHYFTNYGELCEFLDRWRDRPRTVRPQFVDL